jgi:hypothetical protein
MRSIRCRTDSSPPNGTLSIRGQGAAYVVRRDASGVGLRRLLANGVDSVFEDVARSRLPMAEMLGTCSDRSPPERRYYADGEGEQEVERGTLGFEATRWVAADKLRGHMDAAEYMHFSQSGT